MHCIAMGHGLGHHHYNKCSPIPLKKYTVFNDDDGDGGGAAVEGGSGGIVHQAKWSQAPSRVRSG